MSDARFLRWGRWGVIAWGAVFITGTLLLPAKLIVHILAIAALAAAGAWTFWFTTGVLNWIEERESDHES